MLGQFIKLVVRHKFSYFQSVYLLFADSVCLACYVANGHVMTFSLPSLKPLMDVDHAPTLDERSVLRYIHNIISMQYELIY